MVGTLPRERRNARVLVFGLAGAAVIVCGAGLLSRILPDLVPTAANVVPERLAWPLTYWNALGLLAALGAVLCLYLSSDERGGKVTRVLGAAGLPILLPTLLLTFSRGAIAAGAVGVIALLVLGRPRGAVAALLAALPAAIATGQAWRADALQSTDLLSRQAIDQGQELAVVVGLCVLAAAGVRALLLPLDACLERLRVSGSLKVAAVAAGVVALVAGAAIALGPLDAVDRIDKQVELVAAGSSLQERGDVRNRLSNPGNRGRVRHWRVALDAHADKPLSGHGAGTYQLLWAERRPVGFTVVDGHSLYLETLAELGWVGLVLLASALLVPLGALAVKLRGRDRALYASLAAVFVAWALHAGVEWVWEVPAVTLLALSAAAAGLMAVPSRGRVPGRLPRVLVGLGLLIVAVTPVRMAISRRS